MSSDANDHSAGIPSPEQGERRRQVRHKSVYLPCCLRIAESIRVALLRNISAGGAMIETMAPVDPGIELTYFWDGQRSIPARVVWQRDRLIGLENLVEHKLEPSMFPLRALRVPTDMTAEVWHGDRWHAIGIANISQSGLLAYGIIQVPTGTLMTLRIGRRYMPNCAVRWWSDGSAGMRFQTSLKLAELAELVSPDQLSRAMPQGDPRIRSPRSAA